MTLKLGLSNDVGGESSVLGIMGGAFVQRVSEGTPGAESRVNKKGDKVWELHFHNLNGYLKDIYFEDTEYGKRTIFVIDADKQYKLGMSYADGLTATIYKILPNLKPEYPISIKVFLDKKPNDNGKFNTNLFIDQNGASLKWAFTKAEPTNLLVSPEPLPPWEQIMVKGKLTWDNSKQIEWLVTNVIIPLQSKLAVVKRAELAPEPMPEVQIENAPMDIHDTTGTAKGVNMDGSISDENIPF